MAVRPDTLTDSKNFAGKVYGTGKVRSTGRDIAKRVRNLKMHMRGASLEQSVEAGKELAKKFPTEPVKKTVGLGQKATEPLKTVAKEVRQKTLHTKGLEVEAARKPEFKMPKYDPKTAGKLKLKGQFEAHHTRELNKTVTKAFHERGIAELGRKAKAAITPALPKVKVPAKPGIAKKAYDYVVDKGVKFVAENRAIKEAAKKTAENAGKFNIIAKSAPTRAAMRVAGRYAGAAAKPLMYAEAAYDIAKSGAEVAVAKTRADLAGEHFDLEAKQARSRGIVANRRQGFSGFVGKFTGDPGIEVSVPDVKAAEKIAVSKAPDPKTGKKKK